MGSQYTFQAAMSPNGGLALIGPGQGGGGEVSIILDRSPANELTAILNFSGGNQALVMFDASGSVPVSYSLYSVSANSFIEQSVCNIMQQMSSFIPSM